MFQNTKYHVFRIDETANWTSRGMVRQRTLWFKHYSAAGWHRNTHSPSHQLTYSTTKLTNDVSISLAIQAVLTRRSSGNGDSWRQSGEAQVSSIHGRGNETSRWCWSRRNSTGSERAHRCGHTPGCFSLWGRASPELDAPRSSRAFGTGGSGSRFPFDS
jgi:hypothetical protein